MRSALDALEGMPLSYWERGGTDWQRLPAGYMHATTEDTVGSTEQDWLAAKEALATWRVFPEGDWVDVWPKQRVAAGQQVMVQFRIAGLWWTSPCRVVYVIDEPNRFGFAYGTLPGHVEQGEERFLVERDPATGSITYSVRVMARAKHWGARLLPRLTRYMQERFREESVATIRKLIQEQPATSQTPASYTLQP